MHSRLGIDPVAMDVEKWSQPRRTVYCLRCPRRRTGVGLWGRGGGQEFGDQRLHALGDVVADGPHGC